MIISRFIRIAAKVMISFFFMADIPLYIIYPTTSPIHPSLGGHLGYFHVLAFVTSAAMNTEVHVSFQLEFLSFLGMCPGVGSLDHMVTLFLVYYLLKKTEPPNCS